MILTFTTDFGNRDGYAGIMKGVALSITGDITCIDISHEVPPGNIRAAAWVIANSYKFFPSDSVHVVIVDPGVGSDRRGVVVTDGRHTFVGPDNGVLTLVLAGRSDWRAYEIGNRDLWRPVISSTFHGRDIFAPVAAHIAAGLRIENVGESIEPATLCRFKQPEVEAVGKEIRGSIVYVDRFGNLISNIEASYLSGAVNVLCGGIQIPCGQTYSSVAQNCIVAYGGSHGFLEVGVNGGSAAAQLDVSEGACVSVFQN